MVTKNCITYNKTRFGGSINSYESEDINVEWKAPFGDGGVARGSEIKSYFLASNYASMFVGNHFAAELGGAENALTKLQVTKANNPVEKQYLIL